jgi:uncharacterized protein with gpF-like domain
LQAEFGMQEILNTPEAIQLLDNTERLTRSSERYASVLEKLPAERDAAIVQMFSELSREREAAIIQMVDKLSKEREEAITHLVLEEREAIKALLTSQELRSALDQISTEGGEIANKTFIRGALLILLWLFAYVGGKIAYDVLTSRLNRKQRNSH